jgi:TPR repeat protein
MKLAKGGLYNAQARIALCYTKGLGVKQNLILAATYILKSMENGAVQLGQFRLKFMTELFNEILSSLYSCGYVNTDKSAELFYKRLVDALVKHHVDFRTEDTYCFKSAEAK